jgi:hypothetical protein
LLGGIETNRWGGKKKFPPYVCVADIYPIQKRKRFCQKRFSCWHLAHIDHYTLLANFVIFLAVSEHHVLISSKIFYCQSLPRDMETWRQKLTSHQHIFPCISIPSFCFHFVLILTSQTSERWVYFTSTFSFVFLSSSISFISLCFHIIWRWVHC